MDQFNRGSLIRLTQEGISGSRDGGRGLLLVIVAMLVLTVLVTAIYLTATRPAADGPASADEPAWGTATDEIWRVQPAPWWSASP